ncbi:LysR substrate-binding domain-containing protein [Roseicyclus persicicus]|uniref:LysR family transcriptional regulator n=1 Tax=Roseicyclus persicicus TaxID=2650661 RepID=A0A7X6H2K4_9RHOB|nr:LysR substrate-binding domain-containing protein [Roseibacterium persicicum]NKX45671.1 LysR family transcriptional regulator [Roseibacterium persicicum]
MRHLPPPAWLRSFEAAARLGGFTAAAEELGLTPAAVSQQIRSLEARLGYPLFRRLPRGVALTELGQSYLPAVRRAFDDLASATAGLFGVAQGRPLVVRAPPSFAVLCLAPRLARFRAAHPGVAIRLCSSTWADTAPEEQVDVDIRYGDGRWPIEEVRRLTEPGSIPVCPPGTAFGADPAAALRRLVERGAVHIIGCDSFWDAFARAQGWPEDSIGRGVSVDSSHAALEMVAAGMGVALLARDLARPFVAAGRVAVAPGLRLDHDQAHYVLLPAAAGPRPEARLFRDWLVAELSAASEADVEPGPHRAVHLGRDL